MYLAIINYTLGLGVQRATITTDNYKELDTKVNSLVNRLQGQKVSILGYDTIARVESIKYIYPSGKSYIKRF